MDNKYINGKIYIITDIGYNKCYYGSTIQTLAQRMTGHRADYKRYLNGHKSNVASYKIFDEYGIDNCKIELVELYPCGSKCELEKHEGSYIKSNDCMNKKIAGRSYKEYYEDNKDKAKDYYIDNKDKRKQYLLENKDKISEQKRQYLLENKDKIQEYYENNKDKKKEYEMLNKDKINKKRRERYLRSKAKLLLQKE